MSRRIDRGDPTDGDPACWTLRISCRQDDRFVEALPFYADRISLPPSARGWPEGEQRGALRRTSIGWEIRLRCKRCGAPLTAPVAAIEVVANALRSHGVSEVSLQALAASVRSQ